MSDQWEYYPWEQAYREVPTTEVSVSGVPPMSGSLRLDLTWERVNDLECRVRKLQKKVRRMKRKKGKR